MRAKQDHVLASVDEAEFVQALDLLVLDGGLEGEVELVERLHRGQPGGAHGSPEPAVVAQLDLCAEQLLDGLGRRDRAAVDGSVRNSVFGPSSPDLLRPTVSDQDTSCWSRGACGRKVRECGRGGGQRAS